MVWVKNLIVVLVLISLMAGCTTDDDETESAAIANLAIGLSNTFIPTDNSDPITVFATVTDENNAAVSGTTVNFSATGGLLSAATATTDESGIAEVSFSSGYTNQSNQEVTITAETSGFSAQIPVVLTGTTIDLTSSSSTTLTIDGDADILTIYVADAGGNPIYNADVSISVGDASTGNVTFSTTSGRTDVYGELDITITGASVGSAVVSVSAAGALASQAYNVETVENAFAITSPADDPASLAIGNTMDIIVNNPNSGEVVIVTTIGTLTAVSGVTSGGSTGSSLNLDGTSGTVQARLSSSSSGTATITAYEASSPDNIDSITVSIYNVDDAAQLILQAGSSVVAPSSSTLTNTVEVIASVTNAARQPVGNVPVAFTLSNTSNGGEYISPAIVYTGTDGDAKTKFYAGSKSSSGEGITIRAYLLSNESIFDEFSIVIGGTAGSVILAQSSEISSAYDATMYQYTIGVVVADTNGNPVENAEVSLGLWPTRYYSYNYSESRNLQDFLENEDTNRNTYLDDDDDEVDFNEDGMLTPGNSAAGTIPTTVTTDENGVGTFTHTYPKSSGWLIEAEIIATTYVLGSETSSELIFILPISESDADDLPIWETFR